MQRAYKTSDLAPDERVAVERLLGRQLENDEAVQVIVCKRDDAKDAQDAVSPRRAAVRLRELARGKSLGGATPRELIEDGRRF
jgi:hypothetical protein